MFKENLDVFIADFGLDVCYGDVYTRGLFDMPDQNILSGNVTSTEYSLTYKTEVLPNLLSGNKVNVDGIDYKIREVEKIGDGAFSRALLTRV